MIWCVTAWGQEGYGMTCETLSWHYFSTQWLKAFVHSPKKKKIQRRKVFQLFKTVEKTDCNIEMWLLIDWFKFLENVIKYRGDIKSYQF